MEKIGLLGIGNMGYAMLKGALKIFQKEQLTFTDISKERLDYIREQTKVEYQEDNIKLMKTCKYIVLAIKPQFFPDVLAQIKTEVKKEHIFISIAPGISIAQLKKSLKEDLKIVRAIPNTPALVNEGMSGICFSKDSFTEEEKETICKLFESFGKYEMVEEKLMDAVVCASGSSPAYVYMFIEALADSAVKYGIAREKAYIFAAQTVLGSAKMVLETKEHPGKLKDMVCSPGGTTIEAVEALEEYGFRNAVMKAGDACYKKSISFSKE